MKLRLGTRTSALAKHQVAPVISALTAAASARGDEVTIRSVGLAEVDDAVEPAATDAKPETLVAALRVALVSGEVDAIVHPVADLPVEQPSEIDLVAILARPERRVALISGGVPLADLEAGARIAVRTAADRAQLLALRSDVDVVVARGSLASRLAAVEAGQWDATVAPYTHLDDIDRTSAASEIFPEEALLPSPGGYALAVEIRADAPEWVHALASGLDDADCRAAVEAERSALAAMRERTAAPVAAVARVDRGQLELHVRALSADGQLQLNDTSRGPVSEAASLGRTAALSLFGRGVDRLRAGA